MSSFLMIAVVLINVTILVLGLISAGVEMYVSYFSKSLTQSLERGQIRMPVESRR